MEISIDYFIQITFVLLVLSMINEKITNFIKLRFPDNMFKRFLNPPVYLSSYATLDDYQGAQAHRRAREVQTLATFSGVLLAFVCRANLFRIYDPSYELGWISVDWSSYNWIRGFSDFFGCGLTGVFLSLGSKFFHDLLDLLLASKNLKRKLKNRESIKDLYSIEEFEAYIVEIEPLVIEKSVEKYLATIPSVERYEFSEIDNAVDVFLGPIPEKEREKLKRFVNVRLANKKIKAIELNYFQI